MTDWIQTAVCYCAVPTKSLTQFSEPGAPPPHGLQARLYGLKNLYAGLLTAYAAYHISNPDLYYLAAAVYAGALFFQLSEVFVYRTVGISEAVIPIATIGTLLGWMYLHQDFYLL